MRPVEREGAAIAVYQTCQEACLNRGLEVEMRLFNLLVDGADPDFQVDGHSALHWTARTKRWVSTLLLLAAGASTAVTDCAGNTPLDLTIWRDSRLAKTFTSEQPLDDPYKAGSLLGRVAEKGCTALAILNAYGAQSANPKRRRSMFGRKGEEYFHERLQARAFRRCFEIKQELDKADTEMCSTKCNPTKSQEKGSQKIEPNVNPNKKVDTTSKFELFEPRNPTEQEYLEKMIKFGFAPSVNETIEHASRQEGYFQAFDEDNASNLAGWRKAKCTTHALCAKERNLSHVMDAAVIFRSILMKEQAPHTARGCATTAAKLLKAPRQLVIFEVLFMAVHPDAKRRGLATRLVDELKERLVETARNVGLAVPCALCVSIKSASQGKKNALSAFFGLLADGKLSLTESLLISPQLQAYFGHMLV